MDFSWRRLAFITVSCFLCLLGLCLDVYYWQFSNQTSTQTNTVLLVFLILQPSIYYVYYQLGLFAFCICDQDSTSHRIYFAIAAILQAPLYTLLAEFKLLMSPLYKLSQPLLSCPQEDRIKHDMLGPVVIHCFVESFPMALIQTFNNIQTQDWSFINILCLISSSLCILLGSFSAWMIARMNSGGLWWINKPKVDVYLVSNITFVKMDNLAMRTDN